MLARWNVINASLITTRIYFFTCIYPTFIRINALGVYFTASRGPLSTFPLAQQIQKGKGASASREGIYYIIYGKPKSPPIAVPGELITWILPCLESRPVFFLSFASLLPFLGFSSLLDVFLSQFLFFFSLFLLMIHSLFPLFLTLRFLLLLLLHGFL